MPLPQGNRAEVLHRAGNNEVLADDDLTTERAMTDDEFFNAVQQLRFDETLAHQYHSKADSFPVKDARRLRERIDAEICRRNPDMERYLRRNKNNKKTTTK